MNENSPLIYGFQESVEDVKRYREGEYHPVQLGDEFCDGRYRVVHKLGWGSYSTVWLARDQQANRNVALKIIVAIASESSSESRILRLLEQHRASGPDSTGEQSVAKLLDEFTFEGPNGRHTCLVSEPAGCSIADSQEAGDGWLFPLQIARAIATKIVLGVEFLHRVGVVHGDLHTRNIFFRAPDVERLCPDELYQLVGPPTAKPVERLDGGPLGAGVPPYTVWPLSIGKGCEDVTDTDLMIADFGEAYVARDTSPERLNTPILLCPPEWLLKTETVGMPADIWTLACTVYDVLGEANLFEGFWPDEDAVMCEVVSALGKPSEGLWRAWENRHDYFNEDGSWVPEPRKHSAMSRPLDMRIAQMGRAGDENFTKAEQDALLQLLKGMLAYHPKERFTITDVVHSEWMERFGKPAIATLETKSSPQPATEMEKPAEGALGIEVSLPSSTEAEKSPKEDLLEESKDSKVGRSLQTSTEMEKSSYKNLLEESKDLRIERLETPMELPCTEGEKSLNEEIHVEAKDPEGERIEIPKTLSHIEIEKSHSKVSLEEVRDVKVERMETLAKSE
ncbi:MAG: hypothetical protein Q9177_005173 [Variospora cf. flavescens]